MVSAAVAGDDLQGVAGSAADALGCPVAIALPTLGAPVVWPLGSGAPEALRELVEHAHAEIRGESPAESRRLADLVPIRIGQETVGVVAALCEGQLSTDQRAWLEAAAAAAAVTSLMRDTQSGNLESSRRALLLALAAGPPADMNAVVVQARRLGVELNAGAVALCAQAPENVAPRELPTLPGCLMADVGGGRVIALLPLASGADADAGELAAELGARGMAVAMSTPRRAPSDLHDALREAELLLEMAGAPEALLTGQEETYRLLIGVLLRRREELESLRESTISPLEVYDREHDTELLATLQSFLTHHGSTTETAEAMHLHRHTVGYRLTRVQEVSGLSPYETDGRERLGLGLKAHQILEADRRRSERE
jgi:PucR C-terminal helix-turn-helix domain/GGDEF-like domain